MKSIVLTLVLVFSTAAMADIKITEAFNKIINAGEHQGRNNENEKCSVVINTQAESVSVAIDSANSSEVFAILNSSQNYTVDGTTGEITATQSLRSPRYVQGGTKVLNVRKNNAKIEFIISSVLIDHKGDESFSSTNCTISH
jgi:hypothetical protein